MSKQGDIRVALVGLGFGAEFVPIYLHHPDVASVAICDADKQVPAQVGDRYQVSRRFSDLRAIVDADEYDAVHLVTPIPLHAPQSIEVLASGKHCACTVPMATSLADLRGIVAGTDAGDPRDPDLSGLMDLHIHSAPVRTWRESIHGSK